MERTVKRLTQEAIAEINAILARGNTAEVKPRKDDLVVIEVTRKLKIVVSASGQE